MKLYKTLAAGAFSLGLAVSAQVYAESLYVPEIGTAGTSGITVETEKQIGDYFMSMIKGSESSYDPVLNEYISSIGQKLVLHAPNVKFPFEFFLSPDRSLNASAFLGGKVKVHAGLIHYTKNEDEFASVLAHEISHVTQRHIARQLENQSADSSITIGSIVAGIILSLVNPDVGMAVLTTGSSLGIQKGINYTRAIEAEADRVGLSILYESGYNPMAMSDLFRTLMQQQGEIGSVYAMLIDHPLSDIRVAEAYNRASKLPARKYSTNPDFMFAKARIDVRYMGLNLEKLENRLKNTNSVNTYYKNYALALISFENKQYAQTQSYLENMPSLSKDDFIVDLKTDLYIAQNQHDKAISMLEPLFRLKPKDSVVSMNLANLYIEAKMYKKAVSVIRTYLKYRPADNFAYSLLSKAQNLDGNRCQAFQAISWQNYLEGNYKKATMYMTDAIRICRGDDREIAQAKIRKIAKQQEYIERLKTSL